MKNILNNDVLKFCLPENLQKNSVFLRLAQSTKNFARIRIARILIVKNKQYLGES